MVDFGLTGKKALVSGGAGDLGGAVVTALHESGVSTVVLDTIKDLDRWVEKKNQPGKPAIIGMEVDLSDRISLREGFDRAVEKLGGLDILVNAQGIQRRYPVEDFPLDVWDEVIEINLTSVFEMCQLGGRVMLESGGGKIINFASMQSFNGGKFIPAYAASKGGVAILTKSFSNAWASRGININAIAPGYFDTKMTAGVKDDPVRFQNILARIPAGSWGDPEDIAGPVLFLASSAADYVHGVVFPVDGGMLGA